MISSNKRGIRKTLSDGGLAAHSDSSLRLPSIDGAATAKAGSDSGFSSSGLIIGICSKQGRRPYQEDEPCVRAYLSGGVTGSVSGSSIIGTKKQSGGIETHFFGLFDGHAGGRCSRYLSSSLPEVIADDPSFLTNLSSAIKRGFLTANDHFLKIADRLKYQDGSTGLVVVIRSGKLTLGNVGDCRAVLLSSGSRVVQLSRDQKPTDPIEQKRLATLGGSVVYCMGVARVNGVLAVSRAFGNRTLRSVIRPDAELTTRDLCKDDEYLVIGSDGLFDVLRNNDIRDVVYSLDTATPHQLAEELVNAALGRGSMDNVSCVVVSLRGYIERSLTSKAEKATSSLAALLSSSSASVNGPLRVSPLQTDDTELFEDEEKELMVLPITRPGFLSLSMGFSALSGKRATSTTEPPPTLLSTTPINSRFAPGLFRSITPQTTTTTTRNTSPIPPQHQLRLQALHSPLVRLGLGEKKPK